MQLRYRFYMGGDYNPYQKEMVSSYNKLTEERQAVDANREMPLDEIFPQLDSWADYVMANSKYTFWLMERAICKNSEGKAEEIEDIWNEAKASGQIGEWLEKSEEDESVKALCFYIAALHNKFNPDDQTVDFRLYISEGSRQTSFTEGSEYMLEAYE